MSHIPSLDSIEELLSRVLRRLEALEGISERDTEAPQDYREFKDGVTSMLDKRGRLFAAVPALSNLQSWVEVHWNLERQTEPPEDTVITEDRWGNQGETQLDTLSATFKLVLAAWAHGTESVARYAMELQFMG